MNDISPLPLVHGLTPKQMEQVCLDLGQPSFRARQIWRWLYSGCVSDWNEMRNIPQRLRSALAERFSIESVTPRKMEGTKHPRTETKILFQLRDGECIEAVSIPSRGRTTFCISCQVGCRFRCAFCASGQAGFKRNLLTGEMTGQIAAASAPGAGTTGKPSHVVFMGIGEPMDNYEQVLSAIRIINDNNGLNIGARRITISTCGIVPGIKRLRNENIQVELSVSLHSPSDELRSRLMPVNRRYPIKTLLEACGEYILATGRIITFEYTLMDKINDSPAQARELARLLRDLQCRVNLIPLNPVSGFEGRPSGDAAVKRFARILDDSHINTTVRVSRGRNLNAACGQLRAYDQTGAT